MALGQLRASAGQAVGFPKGCAVKSSKKTYGLGIIYTSLCSSYPDPCMHKFILLVVAGMGALHCCSLEMDLEMLPEEGGAGWSHCDAACTACAGELIQTTAQIQGQGRSPAVSKGAALRLALHRALSLLTSGSPLTFAVITQQGHWQMLMSKSLGLCSCPRLCNGDFVPSLLTTGQCISLIEQMNLWDAQSPLGLSRHPWETQGMVSVTQKDCPMLHPMGLPPSIMPWSTNSCSLPPCSSMHRCQACQDTTTPQLRQAGKAKAARGRMRNLSV